MESLLNLSTAFAPASARRRVSTSKEAIVCAWRFRALLYTSSEDEPQQRSEEMKRYYITDRKAVGGFRPLLEVIRDQMHLGVDYIQIREKDLSARELFEFTLAVLEVRANEIRTHMPAKILINSRADIALATGADGVHLPSNAPRETLPGLLVARSCHTLEEIKSAHANFVTFGPVFASPGKQAPMGIEALKIACRLGTPVYALGGVDWENAGECMSAGAEGVAGIRMFQDPSL